MENNRHRLIFTCCLALLSALAVSQNVGISTDIPIGKLHVKGTEDIPQLVIDADTVQSISMPLFKFRKYTGEDLLWLNSDDSTNTFLGLKAGLFNSIGTQGINNTFIGSRAGYSNTIGWDNTALGTNALFSNTEAGFNTAIGSNALYTQSFNPGDAWWQTNNVAVGNEALYTNQPTSTSDGLFNTAVGSYSLRYNSTGRFNTGIGGSSLFYNTIGSQNTAIGLSALETNSTGDNNTAIGYNAGVTVDALTNATAIGYNAKVASSNALVLGGVGPDAVKVGIGTDTPLASLDVNGDIVLRSTGLTIIDSLTLGLDVNTEKFSRYRLSASGEFAVGGITAGVDGRLLILMNQSGFTMHLNHEDLNASIADRIITGNQQDLVLNDMGAVTLQYDAMAQRWVVNNSSNVAQSDVWEPAGTNIYFDNNVGIGIEDPIAPLTIQTDLNETGFSHLAMSGADSIKLESSITDVGAAIGTTTNNIFSLNAGGVGKVHIWPNGRVVMGEDVDPNNFVGDATSSRMTPIEAKLTLETPINSAGWIHIGGQDSIIVSEGIGGVSAAIGTASNHIFRLNSNGQGRLHVYPDGNVVVGTNFEAPVTKFTVHTPNNSHGITHVSDGGIILSTNVGGVSAGIGTFSPHNMRIFANSTAVINIDPTGNIGMGVLTPLAGYKLSVNGNIKAKELVIETTGWPDYVFGEDYKPLSLRDLEAYIDLYHHLPNIPSATELEEGGVAVGDMQKKMMEKIEELTLHILELNKRIESLEKTNHQ